MFDRRKYVWATGEAVRISKDEEAAIRAAMQEIELEARDLNWVVIQLKRFESIVHYAEAALLEEKRKADSGQQINEGMVNLFLNSLEVNKKHLDLVLSHLKKDSKLVYHIRNLISKADHYADFAEKLMKDASIATDSRSMPV